MPNFNGERFLAKAIESFLKSDYPLKQLVIVDGRSEDSSHEIIQGYVSNYDSISWVKNIDKGLSSAINIGLEHANGDVIGYLGSDDFLNDQTLQLVSKYKELIDYDAIYFDSYTYYWRENKCLYRSCPNVNFDKKNLIRYGTIVGLQNIFFSRRVYEKYNFNILNKYSMDYEFYLDIIDAYGSFLHVKHPATVNIFLENISSNLEREQTDEALYVLKNHLSVRDIMYFPIKRWLMHEIRCFLKPKKNN
ncbi:glycosyltransferase [Marinomonas sp. ef1]|uniref:glycosyltransferase n=1 Tax=Marinomonas sp. ef1 TaxID=2005043 RepID=UPI0012FDC793|nr:glycosyltransferase [Marinomonas sp. ef1]